MMKLGIVPVTSLRGVRSFRHIVYTSGIILSQEKVLVVKNIPKYDQNVSSHVPDDVYVLQEAHPLLHPVSTIAEHCSHFHTIRKEHAS